MKAARILREKIDSDDQVATGILCTFHFWPGMVEMAMKAGLDYLIIDLEHLTFDAQTVAEACAIGRREDFPILIRPPAAEFTPMRLAMDLGPCGMLIPTVESLDTMTEIQDAVYMKPRGRRRPGGMGNHWVPDVNYETWKSTVEDHLIILPQIETRTGLANAEAIAAHPLTTAIAVGPYDLATDLGVCWNPEAEALQDALRTIRVAGRAAGKNMWMIGDGVSLVKQGYNFLCITEPTMFLQAKLTELSAAAKDEKVAGEALPLAMKAVFIAICSSAILAAVGSVTAEDQPPNILLITCDNLGYGDLPSYNPDTTIQSPNLDRLASQGARLTSFYTASPTCTVSRACLLTGRIPQRHGLDFQLPGVAGNYGVGLNQEEILIPQILKRAPTPYATGCFGKWNIGFAEGSRPTERGFDKFIGHASGNIDYYSHIYGGRHDLYEGIEELHRQGEYSTDLFAKAAIDFIQRKSKSGDPWLCYLPFNAPHFPSAKNKEPGQPNIWQAPDWAFEAIGLSPEEVDPKNRYDAVVFALDRAIGRVIDALDASGAGDNTFLFFMSDNGGFRLNRKGLDVGINAPLRSGGVTCWEGGLRVPAMVRWPGKIKPGSVIDEPFWSPDLFPVCAKLSGAALPEGVVYDGKNPLPILTEGAKSPHESFFFVYRNHAALRKGDWKIVREKPDQPWQLFNVAVDLAEENNLAPKQPEKVIELEKEFTSWQKSF